LVAQPEVAAVAFTGSRACGMKLKAAADRAGKPAYLEMSSVNPVFVLPGALASPVPKVIDDLGTSMLQGAGQFCTSPGLVVVLAGEPAEQAITALAARLSAAPAGVLLSSSAPSNLAAAVATLGAHGAELVTGGAPLPGPAFRFANTLLRVSGARFLAAPAALQTEAFGSAALVVVAAGADEMVAIAEHLEGSLTACVYSGEGDADEPLYRRLQPALIEKAGRLLDDKMPTGVALSPAMVHGGPYPATGHAGFTAVGVPASIRRFAKLTCFDNVRPARLPH
jgi:NADP-dependent aldehyde dehydrogenase